MPKSELPAMTELESVAMIHKLGDAFNPPAATNFRGALQTCIDAMAIRNLTFPPYSCAGTFWFSSQSTAVLYVDGLYVASTGQPIKFVWRPDGVERETEFEGIQYHSYTAMAVGRNAVLINLELTNKSQTRRAVKLKIMLRGAGVTKQDKPWDNALPPSSEQASRITLYRDKGRILFSSTDTNAHSLQGSIPLSSEIDDLGLTYQVALEPGESWCLAYVNVIGEDLHRIEREYDELTSNFAQELKRVSDEWTKEIQSVFTPGNDRYSGHLPLLVTDNEDLKRLYYVGILGCIFHKRLYESRKVYVTLMPCYWQAMTFLWDTSLSSVLFALLDPQCLREMLEKWMEMDIYQCGGSEYITGKGIGCWYSVNDYAMLKMAYDYLRYTGDFAWLEKDIGGRKVIEYLMSYATHWQDLDINGHGLADYGEVSNLLECVQTYTHEVASLNAANVFNLRFMAKLIGKKDPNKAQQLRETAAALVQRIKELYVSGKGYWSCKQPDGSLREVRHCYDFLTILDTIPNELSRQQKEEMVKFFKEELRTPTWMHALSQRDEDAATSIRPDHQWTGAYTAWPAMTVKALFQLGEYELAVQWLNGLARTARQGPFGQAHIVESVMSPEGEGARKAPPDFPYISDWACAASGSYVDMIIESLLGVNATLFDGITATPRLGSLDPDAKLKNLYYQGNNYSVDQAGIRQEHTP
jgi:hypothetical protein